MKLTPESPELTAYALDQLAPEMRAEVHAALASSPELRAEVDEIQTMSRQLGSAFASEPLLSLDAERRRTILRQIDQPETATRPAGNGELAQGSTVRGKRPGTDNPFQQFLRTWRNALALGLVGAGALVLAAVLWPEYSAGLRSPSKSGSTNSVSPESRFTQSRYPENAGRVKSLTESEEAGSAVRDLTPRQIDPPALSTTTSPDSLAVIPPTPSPSPSPAPATALESLAESRVSEQRSFGFDIGGAVSPASGKEAILQGRSSARRMLSEQQPVSRGGITPLSAAASVDRLSPNTEPQVRLKTELGRSERDLGRAEALQRLDAYHTAPGLQIVTGQGSPPGSESYAPIYDNPFKDVVNSPLSTFSIDVDTASYANVRRFLREGQLPPPDAVRIEELVNYFSYSYAPPTGSQPFATQLELAGCPWNAEHLLARIGIKGKVFPRNERPRANLVFLVDVSGSMEPENRLPLACRALRLVVEKLSERDSVAIVTYAGDAGVALEATPGNQKERINATIDRLTAGGSTHGSAGIQRAYELAEAGRIQEGINRVILCTDGDFNVGITSREALLELITQKAKSGVFLSVLGFGMGNTKDDTMEMLADKGNGNYAYIDSFVEARKVLSEQLDGTLATIAKDVKIQMEFNPARIASYRLIGYENRALYDRDFNDDTKDAGEIGAGHSITVLYELVPSGGAGQAGVDPLRYAAGRGMKEARAEVAASHSNEWFFLKIRYKEPGGDTSKLLEFTAGESEKAFTQASADFRFASAVAGYGMMLRHSVHKGDLTWDKILKIAEAGVATDESGYRAEFIDLARRAKALSGER